MRLSAATCGRARLQPLQPHAQRVYAVLLYKERYPHEAVRPTSVHEATQLEQALGIWLLDM